MILTVNDLNAFYGESHILFDTAFSVEKGESVCLLGRNGVGKSTTLKSIVGLLNPKNKSRTTGSIQFEGRELVGMPSYKIARTGLAYVPQGRHIFPNLTVKENLIIAARKASGEGTAWDIGRIYKLFPRLQEREQSMGNNLSGGEQQMLTIARGLMQNPRLLLLDEITEGLAPIVVNQLVDIIAELRKENITILLAEQNIKFALSCCSRCYIMEKGSIVYEGATADISNEALARYMGV